TKLTREWILLQPSPQFLLTSAGWVITITTSIAPETGVTLSWENTCEPFGDLLPDFLNGRGVC
ncbi:TPA: hypothetical protein ACGB8Z_001124, partial [Escherichia coli]